MRPVARFAFVDGLRGFAALAIVVFHIWWYEPDPQPALESAHWVIDATFLRVRGGVQVLLVISGFVIAYTLRRTWVTPAEVFSFIGRRLIRLVPTYWVAIASVILVDAICRNALGLSSPFEGEVTVSRVSAHMTFLQDVFGHDPLGAGMWTLCIEMQFYFVAVLGLGFAQRIMPRSSTNDPRPSAAGLMLVFAPVALISLFHWRSMESTDVWVTHFLWMFFLGMTTWWSLEKTLPRPVFAATVGVALVELYFDAEWRYENTVALATALSIFVAGRRDKLGVWLNWPWLQHIGKISYSLYLIHFPVCHLLMATGWNWYGNDPTSVQAMMVMAAAFFASLVAGHLLYVLVESPSARWAAKTKVAMT
ncbi:acyltransferase family protein [Schlesneria paludicola]|uniref:acyltransferase family protein n=1 Tax=Schlesneria paludicola TaxID=360056 RepID=UPI0012F91285|nr:acyltransferase [Schlesneria paludicola]